MSVVFKMLPDGGFIAGDTGSRLTSYAYPSSPHAIVAKKHPRAVAEDMLGAEKVHYRQLDSVKEYDNRNWETLEERIVNNA